MNDNVTFFTGASDVADFKLCSQNVRAYQDADFGAAITITASGKDIGGLHGYSLVSWLEFYHRQNNYHNNVVIPYRKHSNDKAIHISQYQLLHCTLTITWHDPLLINYNGYCQLIMVIP